MLDSLRFSRYFVSRKVFEKWTEDLESLYNYKLAKEREKVDKLEAELIKTEDELDDIKGLYLEYFKKYQQLVDHIDYIAHSVIGTKDES